MTRSIDSSAASLASRASASVTPGEHRERAAEVAERLVAELQRLARGDRVGGRVEDRRRGRQKLMTRPSCSCGPGGSSSVGATTGAPARARCDGDRELAPLPGGAGAHRRDRARDARDDGRRAQVDEDVELVAEDDGVVAAQAVGLRHGDGRR